MRLDLVHRGHVTAGATLNLEISKGHINGIMIMSRNRDLVRVTLRRRTDKRTYVLGASLRLFELREISDMEHGYSVGIGPYFQALGSAEIATAAQLQTIQEEAGTWQVDPVYIDLGSLYLGNNHLDVTIEIPAEGPGSHSGIMAVYAVSMQREPDRMLQYDTSLDWEARHGMVDSIFLTTERRISEKALPIRVASNGAITTEDIQIQIEDDSGAWISDLLGAYGITALMTETELAARQQCFVLWRAPRDLIGPGVLPSSVWYRVTGADRESYRLIIRKEIRDSSLVSINTVDELRDIRALVESMERSDPDTAKALRHSGVIVTSGELAAAERDAEVPTD